MEQVTFCMQCGSELPIRSVFCSQCGSRVHGAAAAPAVQAPPPPARPTYHGGTDLFTGTREQLVRLAVRAVNDVGYKLGDVNQAIGIIQFETGMSWGSFSGVSCTVTLEERGDHTFAARGTGKQNVRGGQIVALDLFGEARKRAQKVINRMIALAR